VTEDHREQSARDLQDAVQLHDQRPTGMQPRSTYCFARPSHGYLGSDRRRLRAKDRRRSSRRRAGSESEAPLPRWKASHQRWTKHRSYQKAEGRYHLHPGHRGGSREARNSFSSLTKRTLVLRDLEFACVGRLQSNPCQLALSIGRSSARCGSYRARYVGPRQQRLEAVRRPDSSRRALRRADRPCVRGLSTTQTRAASCTGVPSRLGVHRVTPSRPPPTPRGPREQTRVAGPSPARSRGAVCATFRRLLQRGPSRTASPRSCAR